MPKFINTLKKRSSCLFLTVVLCGFCAEAKGFSNQSDNEKSLASFSKKGLIIEGEDYKFRFGGRLHADFVSVDDEITVFHDDADIRRLRVYGTASFGEKKNLKIKVDGDVGGTSTGLKNIWLSYKGADESFVPEGFSVKVGNFIAPVLGENQKSSNHLKLIERSMPSKLASAFLLGGAVSYKGDDYKITAGYFGNPIRDDALRPVDDGKSIIAKVTYAPIKRKKENLFFSSSLEHRTLDDAVASRVRVAPEFGLNNERLIDTRRVNNVKSYTNYVLEGGYTNGPFAVNAQAVLRNNRASDYNDPQYKGFSVESAYVLTGEKQRFSLGTGTVGKINPKEDFGALEVATRYSNLSLEDGLINGGEQENISLGLNWYINDNVRLMGNYVHANAKPNRNGKNEKAEALLGRFQVAF